LCYSLSFCKKQVFSSKQEKQQRLTAKFTKYARRAQRFLFGLIKVIFKVLDLCDKNINFFIASFADFAIKNQICKSLVTH